MKSSIVCRHATSFAMIRWIAPIAPLGSAARSVTSFESIPPYSIAIWSVSRPHRWPKIAASFRSTCSGASMRTPPRTSISARRVGSAATVASPSAR